MAKRYITSTLLLLSAVMLGTLIPGGPIETRNFSHIDPLILGAFNTFLTALGLLSLLLAYFLLSGGKQTAFLTSAFAGVSFLVVYVLDLGRIFPVSPDPMPHALRIIETAGAAISLPLAVISIALAREVDGNGRNRKHWAFTRRYAFVIVPVILIGIAIVAFATYSAMGE